MDLARRLVVAEAVAQEAGALALAHFRRRDSLVVEAKRTLQDMVTEADREVETLIRQRLATAFPDDAMLGEEHGLTPGRSGLTWVIDPIDGTAPFLAGLPGWCVSIGACDAAGPALGVIRAPVLDESFAAIRGQGARLNGAPIRVTDATLRTGLIGVGANDRVPAASVGRMLAALSEAGASWTRYGSGALMIAWVAAGRLVAYVEPRMSAWDCMAGYALVEAAGGRVLPFDGGPGLTRPAPVLAARPGDYDEILSLARLDDPVAWRLDAARP